MLTTKSLKTVAIAALVVIGTASSSMAAQWAWLDQDSPVKKGHAMGTMTVNWVNEGQKVKVVDEWHNWVKLQIPGQDGWVKANAVSYNNNDFPWPNGGGYGGGSFCINGKGASFCLSSN